MTKRGCIRGAVLGTATAAFALWVVGATFLLLHSGKPRPAAEDRRGSSPGGRLLSPAEKRLTHLANLVSELRQEIGHRRRRVAESDAQLAGLKARLDGPADRAPAVRQLAQQRRDGLPAKFNPKRHLMDVGPRRSSSTLDPVLPGAPRKTPSSGKGQADKDTAAPGEDIAGSTARNHGPNAVLSYGCRDIAGIPLHHKELVGSGFTKGVERALVGGRYVALKTPLTNGQDVTECSKYGMNVDKCFRLANFKILKEIALLQQLEHPNIIKVLGFCLPGMIDTHDPSHTTTIVTEYGEPFTFLDLLKMSWEDRLRISLGVSRLLYYLSNSSIGSLGIRDFKPSQFVRVDGEIKLVDLDDMDDQPKTCRTPLDCALHGRSSTVYVTCLAGKCLNYSDRLNVLSAHKVFFTLLPYETPARLKGMVAELVNKTGEALIGSQETYKQLKTVLHLYSSGEYLNDDDEDEPSYYHRGIQNAYHVLADSDLPDQGDYWCTPSLQMGGPGCVMTAFDDNEAKHLCDQDDQCTAFVMTPAKTWTGRTVIYLKKGTGHQPVHSPGNTLYIQLT